MGLFGDPADKRNAQLGLSSAKQLAGIGKMAGYSNPYIGYGLDLAGLALNPTPENAAKTAFGNMNNIASMLSKSGLFGSSAGASLGHGLTASGMTASEAALAGGNAAAGLGSAGGSAAGGATSAMGGLAAGAAMLPFMAFAGGGPFKMLLPDGETAESIRRRFKRDAEAGAQTDYVVKNAAKGNLKAPMASAHGGQSSVGDALASVLNYNLYGSWAPGGATDVNWYPNLGFRPMQNKLKELGYLGTHIGKDGQVVWNEPGGSLSGGVGEMVMGSGTRFLPPWEDRSFWDRFEGDPIQTDSGLDYSSTHGAKMTMSAPAVGYDMYMRDLSARMGMPVTTKDTYDLTSAPIMTGYLDTGEGGMIPQYAPNPDYQMYMDALKQEAPSTYDTVSEYERLKRMNEEVMRNAWSGAP